MSVGSCCNFTGTDSLMPPTVCRLTDSIEMISGQEVRLHYDFSYGTSLDEAQFWIE